MKITIEFPGAEVARLTFWLALLVLMCVFRGDARAVGVVEVAIAAGCVETATTRKSRAAILYDVACTALMLCFAVTHLARVGP